MQVGEQRVAKPGADATGVMQLAVPVVIAEQQGAKPLPLAFGIGEADDNELVALVAFDLEPVAAPPGAVGPVAALRDRAFEIVLAGMAEEVGAAPHLVVAVSDHALPV